jgi:hypothetical protein
LGHFAKSAKDALSGTHQTTSLAAGSKPGNNVESQFLDPSDNWIKYEKIDSPLQMVRNDNFKVDTDQSKVP